eukprot:scaffold3045_cov271-Chaetoceros_neogracile.AAC.19
MLTSLVSESGFCSNLLKRVIVMRPRHKNMTPSTGEYEHFVMRPRNKNRPGSVQSYKRRESRLLSNFARSLASRTETQDGEFLYILIYEDRKKTGHVPQNWTRQK